MRRVFINMPGKAKFILIPFVAAAFLSLISFVVMQLWNNLLPDIIHAGTITFWQAGGIFILCKILFGFGRMGRFGGDRSLFKNQLAERVKNMDPEERARFKEQFGEHKFNRWRKFSQEADIDEPKEEGN